MNKLKKIMYKYRLLLILIGLLIGINTYAQINLANYKLDYSKPKEFVIGGINVEGTKFLDHKTLIQLSSLEVGSKIMVPGDKLTKACRFPSNGDDFSRNLPTTSGSWPDHRRLCCLHNVIRAWS